jgi:threonine aldolase
MSVTGNEINDTAVTKDSRAEVKVAAVNFLSDNVWGAWPEMLEAVRAAAADSQVSYGGDETTARLEAQFSEVFECPLRIFPVTTGTAANALALATLVPGHGAVFCHASSHIAVDECGAVEFYTQGAKLLTLAGQRGKIVPEDIQSALTHFHRGVVHQSQPAAISVAQPTEVGTVYTPSEIASLANVARANDLKLHMDGARLANAVASLKCVPADVTWRAGVDVLSFGATKGGALAAEAVIFFHPEDARDFEFRRKRSGHLSSKMRFVSAQLEAYLAEGRWLTHAAHANGLARKLASGLKTVEGAELAYPVEANMVFMRFPDSTVAQMRKSGASFYNWEPPKNGRTTIRLVTSFATPEADIERLIDAARAPSP